MALIRTFLYANTSVWLGYRELVILGREREVGPRFWSAVRQKFQVSAIKAPSRNGHSNDDEALKNELPPGVQLEWELEGMSWPPLIVAFDNYEMVR